MTTRLHLFLLLLAVTFICGCGKNTVNATRDRSDVCELHHVHMEKKKVPIYYGMLARTDYGVAYHSARTNLFLHTDVGVEGGCIVDSNSPTQVLIYVCPQCQLARSHWEAEHPKPRKYTEAAIAGEWIGLDIMSWRTEVSRLILKPDRTGVLTQAAKGITNEVDVYRFEISRWCIETNDLIECEFRQRSLYEPLRMTGTMTGGEAVSLTAILHNGEGGWKQEILFWRAKDLDEKLKTLRQ